MNTCKNSHCSTEALTHFLVLLYTSKHCWGILLSISPALILHDYCNNHSKLLCSESIDLRPEEELVFICWLVARPFFARALFPLGMQGGMSPSKSYFCPPLTFIRSNSIQLKLPHWNLAEAVPYYPAAERSSSTCWNTHLGRLHSLLCTQTNTFNMWCSQVFKGIFYALGFASWATYRLPYVVAGGCWRINTYSL